MTSRAHTVPRIVALLATMVLILSACGGSSTVLSSPIIEPADVADPGPGADDSDAGGEGGEVDDEIAAPATPQPTAEPTPEAEPDTAVGDEDFAPEELAFNFDAIIDDGDTDDADTDDVDSDETTGAGSGAETVATVVRAVAATASHTSYRWESQFAMRVADGTVELDIAPAEPALVGEVAGAVSSVSVDLGAILDEILAALGSPQSAAEFFGSDLTMTLIDDGIGSLYIEAPLLAAVAQSTGLDGADKLARLADGWGVIDLLRAEAVEASEFASLAGAQSGGTPEAVLALLAAPSAGSVQEIGGAEIRGVATTGYRVDVPLADMVAAQGLEDDDLAGLAGTTIAELPDTTQPVDLFIDDDGFVRRVTVVLDLGAFGAGVIPAGAVFSMTSSLDFFDFGADVDIDVPDSNIVVDLTNEVDTLFG